MSNKATLQKLVEESQHYSYVTKKLREDVDKIFSIFNNPKFCRLCDQKSDADNHNLTKVKNVADYHQFIACIDIPFRIEGEEFHFVPGNEDTPGRHYSLLALPETDDSWPAVNIFLEKVDADGNEDTQTFSFENAYKDTIKALVNNGAIQKFFDRMVRILKETNAEYDAAAEVAAKIRGALES